MSVVVPVRAFVRADISQYSIQVEKNGLHAHVRRKEENKNPSIQE